MDALKSLDSWVLSVMLIVVSVLLTKLINKIGALNNAVILLTKTNAVQTVACKMTHEGVKARLDAHASDIKDLKTDLKNHIHE